MAQNDRRRKTQAFQLFQAAIENIEIDMPVINAAGTPAAVLPECQSRPQARLGSKELWRANPDGIIVKLPGKAFVGELKVRIQDGFGIVPDFHQINQVRTPVMKLTLECRPAPRHQHGEGPRIPSRPHPESCACNSAGSVRDGKSDIAVQSSPAFHFFPVAAKEGVGQADAFGGLHKSKMKLVPITESQLIVIDNDMSIPWTSYRQGAHRSDAHKPWLIELIW